jgi:hypothetical protein
LITIAPVSSVTEIATVRLLLASLPIVIVEVSDVSIALQLISSEADIVT